MNERTKAILLAANSGAACSSKDKKKRKKMDPDHKAPAVNNQKAVLVGDPALGIYKHPNGVYSTNAITLPFTPTKKAAIAAGKALRQNESTPTKKGHYGHLMGAKRNHDKCMECIKAGDHQGASAAADKVSAYAAAHGGPEAQAMADAAHSSCAKCRKEGSAMHKYHLSKKSPKKGLGMAKKSLPAKVQNAAKGGNPNHDPKNGRFASGKGGSSGPSEAEYFKHAKSKGMKVIDEGKSSKVDRSVGKLSDPAYFRKTGPGHGVNYIRSAKTAERMSKLARGSGGDPMHHYDAMEAHVFAASAASERYGNKSSQYAKHDKASRYHEKMAGASSSRRR